MKLLFGGDSEPFLSVEAESVEQISGEDPMFQVIPHKIPGARQKRKQEEAFLSSPTEGTQPETSGKIMTHHWNT